MKIKLWFVFLLCLWAQSGVHAESLYPFHDIKQQAQFEGLLHELRCLVCQNQDIADSQASLAKDLRQEVYQAVLAGQSDAEIMQVLVARYGDFIVFTPPVKSLTWLLWYGPFGFLILGLILFALRIKRKSL